MLKDISKGVSALIYIRVMVVTLLLGSFYVYEIGQEKLLYPTVLSYYIASLYFLTIVYVLTFRALKKRRDFVLFAYVQIIVDISAETILIYLTGGIGSMFAFMFPLSILSAGIVLTRRACYIMATLSSLLYATLLDLQFYNMIATNDIVTYTEKDFFYNIFAHVIGFYLIGFLAGYLSEKLNRATQSLEERETVLSDLKAFNEYIIDSMPSGIFTTDLDKKIISFNTAAQEITKLTNRDVAGKTPEDIFPFLSSCVESLDRVEGMIQRKGEQFTVGMRLSSLKDSAGQSIGVIGVFQDLTELKAMEAEVKRKEKWAFIGELSASIAHELRNPLAALKGSVEMLREKKVSEEHGDHLMNIALSEMDRLNGIVTDFLLYAKPQGLNKETFDLHESLREVVTLLKSSESIHENVKLSAEFEGQMPVTGDARQVRQVFWNLGLNAIDAVSAGGTVEMFSETNKNSVEVIFKDSGTGIDTEDIDKVFYPFFTTKEQGTGLGLSIAQKIIEEHGGKITVESPGPNLGTIFKIVLPLNNV
jgi:two-component system sensor histidine kinase PilS (NtrC family)